MRAPKRVRVVSATLVLCVTVSLLGGCSYGNSTSVADLMGDAVQGALDTASSVLDGVSGVLSDTFGDAANDASASLEDASRALSDVGDIPSLLAETFGADGLAQKAARIDVEDASTGKVVASYDADDQAAVMASLSELDYSSWTVVSSHPDDATAEYVIRLYQQETQKLGQSADEVGMQEPATITTYAGSNVVQIAVPGWAITVDIELPAADMETLRGLVS